MNDNQILDGLVGLCIGDALGVPVEFSKRAELTREPVTDMIGKRRPYFQPPGTWSDDSSLALCLVESLCHGFDPHDMAARFCRWYYDAYWTPHGSVFDVGGATRIALLRLKQGVEPKEAGGKGEFDNGNGSLMRILPLAYYLQQIQDTSTRFHMIHDVSAITHAPAFAARLRHLHPIRLTPAETEPRRATPTNRLNTIFLIITGSAVQ